MIQLRKNYNKIFILLAGFLVIISLSNLEARRKKWKRSKTLQKHSYEIQPWIGWSFPFTKTLGVLDDAKLEASEKGGGVEYAKSDLSLGVDVYKTFTAKLQLGLALAYLRLWNFEYSYIQKDVFYGDENMSMKYSSSFLPLSLQVRYEILERFYIGSGIGYALSLGTYNKCTDESCVDSGAIGSGLMTSLLLEYHYPLNHEMSIAARLHTQVIFIDPLLLNINPGLTFNWKF